jgi:predicted phosphodiesterase
MPKPIQTERGKVIDEFVRKYPDAGKRTLAKALVDGGLCENVNQARSAVRYYLGTMGNRNREARGVEKDEAPLGEAGKPVGKLPPGIKQTLESLSFSGAHKWLMLSDIHAPYHDEAAIETAVATAKAEGCDGLCINGDLFDFYQGSRFIRDPRFRSLKSEIETGKLILDYFDGEFSGPKVFKVGNHDDRFEHYIWGNAPMLSDFDELTLPAILGLEARGWSYVASSQHYSLGRLPVFHGHELPRGLTDPVNVARGVWLRVRESAIVGHWHKPSTHIETAGITKKVTTCYSTGCMCDLRPAYATVNSWAQGFAIVTVGADGDYHVSLRTIDRGKAYATE